MRVRPSFQASAEVDLPTGDHIRVVVFEWGDALLLLFPIKKLLEGWFGG